MTADALIYLLAGILIVWGIAGLLALFDVSREWGWGIAFLLFGAYLALGWTALRP